jgi:predicted dehydrogenase
MRNKVIRFGVVGFGYWGPNIVRNLMQMKDAHLSAVCDRDKKALKRVLHFYPSVPVYQNYRDLIRSKDIDVIAVATPLSTHFSIARDVLQSGKHLFVEKPFVTSQKEAEILIDLAKKQSVQIMVDHTFLFTGAVRKMKEIVDQKTLGNLYYYDSTRINLGIFQPDANVVWDLAVHDFTILDYIIKNKPCALSAHGAAHFVKDQETLAYITVYFDHNFIANINVNWLSPVKIRTVLIGGEKQMLVWDDLKNDEKIKIYDRGVKAISKEGIYRLMIGYRSGKMWSPKIEQEEALTIELGYFIDCIRKHQTPINDGLAGLRIVKMLEATTRSLKNNGKLQKL